MIALRGENDGAPERRAMSTPLPAAPSLEQLRKQAKQLVRKQRGR